MKPPTQRPHQVAVFRNAKSACCAARVMSIKSTWRQGPPNPGYYRYSVWATDRGQRRRQTNIKYDWFGTMMNFTIVGSIDPDTRIQFL